MSSFDYPVDLNPFGDDDEDGEDNRQDYPDYLSPFGDNTGDDCTNPKEANSNHDDYDDSLNPFGEPEETHDNKVINGSNNTNKQHVSEEYPSGVNPFEDLEEATEDNIVTERPVVKERTNKKIEESTSKFNSTAQQDDDFDNKQQNSVVEEATNSDLTNKQKPKPVATPQPELLEPPPIPFPRTKSLLKKAQQQANRTKIEQERKKSRS